jgi:hypothetical protein
MEGAYQRLTLGFAEQDASHCAAKSLKPTHLVWKAIEVGTPQAITLNCVFQKQVLVPAQLYGFSAHL